MTAFQREQTRLSTLRYCEAALDMGLATSILLQALRAEGLGRLRMEQLREELRYLEEKGLLKRKFKLLSPENEIWQLTADGRDFLAQGDLE